MGEPAPERWSDDDASECAYDDEDDVPPSRAGELLVEFLVKMLVSGAMSAKTLCTVCWFCWKAGCESERVRAFACRPSSASGNFQRKVDRALRVSTAQPSHTIRLPTYRHGEGRRRIVQTPVEIPYEAIIEEALDEPLFEADMQTAAIDGKLPPSYYNHEVIVIAR